MNKKGGMGMGMAIFLIGLLMVAGIGAAVWLTKGQQSAVGDGTTLGAGTSVSPVTGCPDTKKTVKFKVYDSDASVATQLASSIELYEVKADGTLGLNIATDTGSGSTGTWSTGTALCGKYRAVALTGAGLRTSAQKDFNIASQDVFVEMFATQTTYLTTRVKDVSTDAYQYQSTGGSWAANATTYTNLNSTLVASDAVNTAIAVGADGKLQLKLYLQSSAARKYFGDKAKNTFVCVDLGTNSVWDEPSVSVAGAVKNNVKGTFTSNDLVNTYISASEYCYNIGTPIPNAETIVDVTVNARSGQNPSTSDDVIFYILPEGTYKSVAPSTYNLPIIGMFTDASTQVGVGYSASYLPMLQIQVS